MSFDALASIPFSLFLQESSQSLFISVGCYFFSLHFDSCCWYENGQKWNTAFKCIYCLLQCCMRFHIPQHFEFSISCRPVCSFTVNFPSTFFLTNDFFSWHHWTFMCLFSARWIFFLFFKSLNVFLTSVLPSIISEIAALRAGAGYIFFYCNSDSTVIEVFGWSRGKSNSKIIVYIYAMKVFGDISSLLKL